MGMDPKAMKIQFFNEKVELRTTFHFHLNLIFKELKYLLDSHMSKQMLPSVKM